MLLGSLQLLFFIHSEWAVGGKVGIVGGAQAVPLMCCITPQLAARVMSVWLLHVIQLEPLHASFEMEHLDPFVELIGSAGAITCWD